MTHFQRQALLWTIPMACLRREAMSPLLACKLPIEPVFSRGHRPVSLYCGGLLIRAALSTQQHLSLAKV